MALRKLFDPRMLLIVLFSIGCAPPSMFVSVVNFGSPPTEGTFAFSPRPGQADSLEWRSYCDLVECLLERQGLKHVSDAKRADYLLEVDFIIDGGLTQTTIEPTYGQIQPSAPGSSSSTSPGDPAGGVPRYGQTGSVQVSSVRYQRAFLLKMSRTRIVSSESRRVWEIRVLSDGDSAELSRVMPTMIDGGLRGTLDAKSAIPEQLQLEIKPLPALLSECSEDESRRTTR
jgi:hypothetical protein